MSKLDKLKDFRGGVIYRAADVLPATAHTWPLKIGTKSSVGHPRYDALDALMLSLMRVLTVELGMPAARAAALLNHASGLIRCTVEEVVAEQETKRKWRWDGGPYLWMVPNPSGIPESGERLIILNEAQRRSLKPGRDTGPMHLLLSLPFYVCRTLLSLENVLSGNKPALDVD